jgi:hypothetical protein
MAALRGGIARIIGRFFHADSNLLLLPCSSGADLLLRVLTTTGDRGSAGEEAAKACQFRQSLKAVRRKKTRPRCSWARSSRASILSAWPRGAVNLPGPPGSSLLARGIDGESAGYLTMCLTWEGVLQVAGFRGATC